MAKREFTPIDTLLSGRTTKSLQDIALTRPPDPLAMTPIATRIGAIIPDYSSWVEVYTVEFVQQLFPDRGSHPNLYVTAEIFTLILNHIANTGVYHKACVAAGIGTRQFEKLRKALPILEVMTQDALDVYRQKLASVIHDRAVEGWDEPVFGGAGIIGYKHKFSERLLELQAKRHIPEYRDHTTTDLNVSGGVLVVHAPMISREEWLAQHRKQVESAPCEESKKP